jgi:outer membrane protein
VTLFRTQYTGNLTPRAQDVFGNPSENPVTGWTYFSETSQSLGLTWRIQGRSMFDALSRQRLTNLDREIAETRALTDLEIDVRRAYWDASEQRELLRAEEALVDGRRMDHEVAERLFSLALRTRVDVLNAELAVEQQALAERQQRAAHDKALLTLRTSLGDDRLGPFRLADEALPIFDPSALDAEPLVRTALEVNPELRQADVAVRGARAGLGATRSTWWPTLVLNYQVGRLAQGSDTGALFEVANGVDVSHRFYVGFDIPMFNDYFQNRSNIQQSAVELRNQQEAARETRLRVEETVRGALLELSNQWESLRVVRRTAEIAGEALRLAREEYRIGTRTFEDLRQTIDQEADTRRQVIEARYAFVDALLDLEAAVGTEVRSPAGGAE